MSNYKTVQFKVLPDNCSAEDLLDDRTHQRIADKLYEIISANPQEGLTIGLEGEWGSGKSTVVKLLQEKLKENKANKTFVFYIDAWEHEGDHLRRVFLETFIEKLKRWKEWNSDVVDRLNDISDRVTSKKVSKKVEHASQITGFGKAVAFAALLVPLGASLLTVFAERVTTKWTGVVCWEFWASFLLTMAPVLVYVWRWLRNLLCSKEKKYSLFETEANVDTIYETSREEERSSVEFERYFGEILQIVSAAIDSMIMVIDNLDRVNSEDALRIWSTLQAFVQNKNPVVTKGRQLCKWIIVPYAQEGLSKIWAEGEGNRPLSFMDKSFQLRLHVPKMVISGWKGFARKCIGEAAPSLDGEDVEKMLNVLSWTRDNLTDAPSPRQIKIYINQVGVACSLHGSSVPLEAICFYVVKKYLNGLSDRQLEDDLRNKKISAASLPQYANCYELPAEVAAILYGVGAEKAMQILLAPIITESLRNSNNDELSVIEEMHGDVFYDVLNYILKCSESNLIPKFVGSIQKAFPESNTKAYNSALNALRLHEKVALEQMQGAVHEDAIAIIELASNDTNKDLVRSLAKAYALDLPKRFRRDGGTTPPLNPKDEYIDAPSELVKRFDDVTSAAKEPIKIPYDRFRDAGVDFAKFTAEELKKLGRYMSNMDIADEDIAEQIHGGGTPEWACYLFIALILNGMKTTRKTIESVCRTFDGGDESRCFSAIYYWPMILAIERIDKGVRPIDEVKDLLLSERCWSSNNSPTLEPIFLTAKYHGELTDSELTSYDVPSEYMDIWNTKDYDKGKEIYRYITYSYEFDWLAVEASKPNRALVGSIAEAALDANDKYLFKVEKPLVFLANLYSLVDADHKKVLAESFISSDERLTRLIRGDGEKFVDSPLVCQKLLTATKGRDIHNALVQRIKAELGGLSQEEWSNALIASNDMAGLVAELEQDDVQLNLANPFANAFKDLVAEMIKNNVERGVPSETLTSLHSAMKGVFHNIFASGLGDILGETKFDIATDSIKEFVLNVPEYGEWIINSGSQIKNLAVELATIESMGEFDNFITIIQRCGNRLANKEEIKEIIEQPVQMMLKHEDSKVKEVGEKAAACFGIEAIAESNVEGEGKSDEGKK